MKFKHTFPACSGDYYGYVHPNYLMREIDEGVAKRNYEDGVGFAHLFPTIGATWMLGQCVLEFLEPVYTLAEVEIETSAHEQHGVSVVRRCVMRCEGREVMRFAAKTLPVYFEARKIVSAEALKPFWKSAAIPAKEPIPFIGMPEDMETVEEYRVRVFDCDTNRHLSAFKYLDLVLESAGYWEGEMHLARRVQIDFRKEALLGEVLQLRHREIDGIHYCCGVKEDGTVSFNATVVYADEMTPLPTTYNG